MRLLNQFYACFFGYFWLPCPMCGRMFGGHESGWGSKDGKVLCNRCPDKMFDKDGDEVVMQWNGYRPEDMQNAIKYVKKKSLYK